MAELNYCRFDNLHTAVHVFTNQKMCRIAYSLCKVFLIIPAELIYYQYASYHWIGTLLSHCASLSSYFMLLLYITLCLFVFLFYTAPLYHTVSLCLLILYCSSISHCVSLSSYLMLLLYIYCASLSSYFMLLLYITLCLFVFLFYAAPLYHTVSLCLILCCSSISTVPLCLLILYCSSISHCVSLSSYFILLLYITLCLFVFLFYTAPLYHTVSLCLLI